MAARSRATVRVFDSVIAGMFREGGDVTDEARKIAQRTRVVAVRRASAFSDTGHLAASHRIAITPSGLYGVRSYVYNTASYARFKHNGTQGPIRSIRPLDRRGRAPGKLALGKKNGAIVAFRNEVPGQQGEPWLLEAGNEVLLRYGVRARQTR